MNGSRLAETDSTHWMPLGWMPSSPAMILAISTSNPSRLPSRFFWPNSGWSNLVPTRTLPACWSRAMVEPSAKLAPPPAWPPPPQAAASSIRATTVATIPVARRVRIMGPSLSVADDLGEEVLCPLRPRVGEEVVRRPLLEDLAGVHEHHPVGGRPGEPHLVADHHHRHAGGRQVPHDVQDLVDHLRVQRRGRLVEQQQLGVHRQRAGDRDPLLLAAGELGGQLV